MTAALTLFVACSSGGGGGTESGGGGTTNPPADTTAPVLSITAPEGTSSTISEGGSINFTATAVDAVDGDISASIEWLLDGALQATAANWDASFSAQGAYSVTARISDVAGNIATVNFTVTVNQTLNLLPSNDYKLRIPFVCSNQASMVSNTTDELPSVSAVSADEFLETGVLLGRPTSTSISVSILPVESISEVQINYSTAEEYLGGTGSLESEPLSINACEASVVELTNLAPNSKYYYQISYTDAVGEQVSSVGQFHTARATGQSFSFAIHADPHVGSLFRFPTRHIAQEQQNETSNEEIYAVTLANTLASGVDFMIDLGDTFMSEKNEGRGLYQSQYEAYDAAGGTLDVRDYPMTEQELIGDYAYLRSLFAQAAHSVPLFLTVGNHEAEVEKLISGPDGYTPAIWGNNARKSFFPVPTACTHESFENNGFYSGSTESDDSLDGNIVGNNCHDSFYSWQWGDALFIVLDPMWQAADVPGSAPRAWGKSLGLEQYDWLTQTLDEHSDVPFKFVFMHNLVGGFRNAFGSERAGALLANYYEWGGCSENWEEVYPDLSEFDLSVLVHPEDFDVDSSCTSEFGLYRSGWDKPIQDILLEHGVQIVFHGHDHIYVREKHPNGLVYQTVPQPSIPGDNVNRARDRSEDYNYDPTGQVPSVDTVVDSSSGFLLVTVNAGEVEGSQTTKVEYRKSVQDTTCLDGSNTCFSVDGEVDSTYKISVSSDLYTSATDADADGVSDIEDAFPDDPNEDTDTDNDGVGDNSDPYPNGGESLGLTDIVLRDPNAALVADFYAPAPLGDKLLEERAVNWTQITATPGNLDRFSFGEAGTENIFALTDDSDSVDSSLSISAGLAAEAQVDNDLLLRSMFQFVEVETGKYAIYSTKHANYALDVSGDGTSLILRDVRSLAAYSAGTGSFLTFEPGASPLTLVANGRYLFDAAGSVANDTLAFEEDTSWTDQEIVFNGTSLELAASGGSSMNLYEATIGLEIPFNFNPEERPRFPNLEYWDTSTHDETDRIQQHADALSAPYNAQVSSPGIDSDTLDAVESTLDDIELALASQGSQMRYPREFYLAVREGMLRRRILAEESTDGQIGDLIVPYIYFTNEMDTNGNYHPYMVITTHGVPDALALLWDVPHPPGDGIVQGYDNQNVTRSYYLENFILGIPIRDYGEVFEVTDNNLDLMNVANPNRSLAQENNLPFAEYDHHNYASTNESAVAVDGVVVFPSYNNGLNFSQEPGELSVRGMHAGRGLGVHYHADPHSAAFAHPSDNTDTGLNLYNESDYLGRNHPPIVSIGFDGVAGYGFYLDGDTTSDGANIPLNDFGAHEHGDYGYHYHVIEMERQVGGTDYTTHELGPLGAWAGRINYLPLDGFRPRNNTIWVDGQ